MFKSEEENCKMCREGTEAGVVVVEEGIIFPKSVLSQTIPLWSASVILTLDLGDKRLKSSSEFSAVTTLRVLLHACSSFLVF